MRWFFTLAALSIACKGDDAPTPTDGPAPSACEAGCTETLAAACSNGPADQATCESDCEALLAGGCGSAYQDVLDCSDGEPVTCDVDGRPAVEACATELGAFVSCLNGG